MAPLDGDQPGTIYYYLPVMCLCRNCGRGGTGNCGWEGMVVGRHPRPTFNVRRHYCGQCGHHRLVDREPDPDDENWYRTAKPAEQLVAVSMRDHGKMRTRKFWERTARGFRVVSRAR